MEEKQKFIKSRSSFKGQLTIFKKVFEGFQGKTSLSDVELSEVQERLTKLDILYDKFENVQNELEMLAEDIDVELKERSMFEDGYFALKSQAKVMLKGFTLEVDDSSSLNGSGSHRSSHRSNNSHRSMSADLRGVKLPVITLPKFSGDYKAWLEFRDIFSSLIHENETLTLIQKFHYLRASLEGVAAQVISSLDFCSTNYSIAWTTLCDRFNNNKLLVHLHLKSLFDLEPINKESAEKIRFLIDSVSKSLNALTALKQETEHWGTLIMYLVSTKLDPITDREWEEFKGSKDEILSWEDLKGFLKSRADLLETLERKGGLEVHNKKDSSKFQEKRRYGPGSKTFHANEVKCVSCKGNHSILNCSDFLKMSVNDRVDKVKQLRLCINCLKGGHYSRFCRFNACNKCKLKHNILLHFDTPKAAEPEVSADQHQQQVSLSSFNSDVHVLLSTVLLEIQDINGSWHVARALLDCGSQSNFISLELCERLKINKEDIHITVGGLGQSSSRVKYRCNVSVQSLHNGFSTNLNCLVLPEITGYIPSVKLDVSSLDIPKNITLADPSYHRPGKVDLLIGNELFYQLLCIGQVNLGSNKPILQKTRFGWVISGPIVGLSKNPEVFCNFSMNSSQSSVEFDLQRFWEVEHDFSSVKRVWSEEESACEAHFKETFQRDIDGRFIVSMPLKGPIDSLGDSWERARHRFLSLERKLQSNADFKRMYQGFMDEYRDLGHMSEVVLEDVNKFAYYMPHHGVMKKESLTTKLRVVFDCSMQTSTGVSLNDLQMVGPVIQPDLISILLRFREFQFVVSADVAKMYRQVLIAPNQRNLQRILWRDSTSDPIKIYNLNTVTYGQASASYLAVRCISQLADDCEAESPGVSKVIRNSFYVDDYLCSFASVEEAIAMSKAVSAVLETGKFQLRKWMSNDKEILSGMSHDDKEFNVIEFGENENAKTLGLTWSCASDYLTYTIGKYDICNKVSKRTILSSIAQVFDPLGLLSPCVIIVKILIQKLWLEKLSWDEALPSNLHNVWLKFRMELYSINDLKIPRHASCPKALVVELHGFSDASDDAYGGAIYLRTIDSEGTITVRLLCAKSKVSPLKRLTTPRLEICGALVLARLLDKVLRSLNMKINRCVLWTDSTIVIGWLRTSPNMLQTFISSRVSEIQSLTANQEWRHISSKLNPADVLSRGVSPKQILNLDLWWNGPQFLGGDEDTWPQSIVKPENLPDLRTKKKIFSLMSIEFDEYIFSKFSSYSKLVRVTAWVLRFRQNCVAEKNGYNLLKGSLSTKEINNAISCLVRASQKLSFSEEYSCLEQGIPLENKSRLLSLNPFLDGKGLLRVGGRLRHADFSFNKRHPMLISPKHPIAKLICDYEHKRLMHAGPQLLLASIRNKYWPVSGRNLVRATVKKCLRCCRFSPQAIRPIMGDLPADRLNSRSVFEIVGVDYMGPLHIKDKKGRGAKMSKCYVSVFVCFLTKALHLEVVTDLTSDAFLLTFRRFVARRGKPSQVFSDNGKMRKGWVICLRKKECNGILYQPNPLTLEDYGRRV
ncbi:uncharacterized protein LOC126739769 [Anthonomus grandis grandis]|uniref:uncharacterized protein LOC126739769 n=1 Tax=Anthonomus grandis grandis TaxID=2921223 RepID=UPI002166A30F|nr:uncharacterized protein LOC126739769 [Anthonomus grandis grandis]